MKVDISPKRPPSSSWTTDAPLGSGSEGGGSSMPRRSMRRIMGSPLVGCAPSGTPDGLPQTHSGSPPGGARRAPRYAPSLVTRPTVVRADASAGIGERNPAKYCVTGEPERRVTHFSSIAREADARDSGLVRGRSVVPFGDAGAMSPAVRRHALLFLLAALAAGLVAPALGAALPANPWTGRWQSGSDVITLDPGRVPDQRHRPVSGDHEPGSDLQRQRLGRQHDRELRLQRAPSAPGRGAPSRGPWPPTGRRSAAVASPSSARGSASRGPTWGAARSPDRPRPRPRPRPRRPHPRTVRAVPGVVSGGSPRTR